MSEKVVEIEYTIECGRGLHSPAMKQSNVAAALLALLCDGRTAHADLR